MNMTHYMELLAVNQPWNLLIFMAGPVILAETLAITELYLLYTRRLSGPVAALNRACGLAVGLYFVGIIAYLMTNAVLPITQAGQWRTIIDVVAVGSYLLAGLPMIYIALQELGLVERGRDPWQKFKTHALCVALFLVLAHVAMITGMMDPGLLGWQSPDAGHGMSHAATPAADAGNAMVAPSPAATASAMAPMLHGMAHGGAGGHGAN